MDSQIEDQGATPSQGADWMVLAVLFVSGAVLMAVEIVGARILTVSFGSTIFIWGTLLGVFMGSLSIGYTIGGRLSDLSASRRTMGLVALAGGITIIPVPVAGYAIGRFVSEHLGGGGPSAALGPFVAMVLLFLLPGIAVGMLSPFGIRVLARSIDAIGKVTGKVYGFQALGSIAGSLLVVFFLMSFLSNRVILCASAAILGLSGAILALVSESVSRGQNEDETKEKE
jgi:MFS family permease